MGQSRPLFFYFRLFYKQLTVNKCSIKVADDWIRTRVLWCCKRPLCQLRHNHFPQPLSVLTDQMRVKIRFDVNVAPKTTLNHIIGHPTSDPPELQAMSVFNKFLGSVDVLTSRFKYVFTYPHFTSINLELKSVKGQIPK